MANLDTLLDALEDARMSDNWQAYADAVDALHAGYANHGVDWAQVPSTERRTFQG